jgi:hypothetical protein
MRAFFLRALHAAKDTDQTLDQVGSLSQDLIDQLVLAMAPLEEAVFDASLLGCALSMVDQSLGLLLRKVHEFAPADLRTWSTKPSRAGPLLMGRCPLKTTRSKQQSTTTIKLVNLVTKRESVFMAFSFGIGPFPTPF